MNTMEVLAPAGGWEQLLATVRCGADAVYLGAKGFNARRGAENFCDLAEAVSYCHARGVAVHVTLNTLVTDDEMPALLDTLSEIARSGADAVIVQDLAVAGLVRARCPSLALHASTQMTIHNAAGAAALEPLGFSRAVLARELTLPEIRSIAEQTSLALEAFVHGALCVSASGACYLSSMLGGRSGNRGLCAQPCRLDFRAGERGYALSLKDLSALDHLRALAEAGVTALKIEGRMKRPEYVAAAVTACREALEGRPYDMRTLEAAFSRGGFTDGYLTGKRGLSMFGVRSGADAAASQKVESALQALYRRERPAVPVHMRLCLEAGVSASLTVSDGRHTIHAAGDVPRAALAAPTDEARARRSLEKLGGTPFFLKTLSVHSDGTLMLPSSSLNALRRDAAASLLSRRMAPAPHAYHAAPLPLLPEHIAKDTPGLRLRFETAAQRWPGVTAERVILPISQITPAILAAHGDTLAAELPALCFPEEEEALLKRLQSLSSQGLRFAQAENFCALAIARAAGLDVLGGAGLNALNSLALAAYADMGAKDVTVSFELHRQKICRLGGGLPRGAIAYGYLPLMRLRVCPARGANGCGACAGRTALTDRTGASFPLLCHQRQYATLLNAVPLNLSDDPLARVDFCTLYFTIETADECRRVYEAFRSGGKPAGARTRGLYHRNLL